MKAGLALFGLLIAAVALVVLISANVASDRPESVPIASGAPIELADPDAVPDATTGGTDLPQGYRLVLPRDAIAPIYEPEFVPAVAVDWSDDTLVIGVEVSGEAKAYPVSFLNRREMVIDRLGGIPILVSW